MVAADDVDDLIQRDLPKAFELLKEMNDNAVQVAHLVDEMLVRVKRGELSTAKGLSFLEVKYHMLLSYLINLTYVVLRKCTGEPIEADPAIDRLVELRTVLEKTRPIDQKLKYQVDKLVKAAVTGATSQNDPTNFKANPDNMIMKLDNEGYSSSEGDGSEEEGQKKGKKEKKGKYVPPKLASVPYDGEDTVEEREKRQLERAKKRVLNSSMIQELKEEYLDTPLEVSHGSSRQMETSKQLKARQEYEETYFTRLPVPKAERHQGRRAATLGTLANELTSFGDLTALEPGASTGLNKRKRKNPKKPAMKSFKGGEETLRLQEVPRAWKKPKMADKGFKRAFILYKGVVHKAMHTNVNIERNSWRLPPDDTVQVGAGPKEEEEEEWIVVEGAVSRKRAGWMKWLDSDLGVVEDGYNWKSIVLSLLVIGTVIAGIVTAIYLLGYVDELLYWSGKRMTLDEYLQDDGGLAVLDTADYTVSLLVTNHTLRQLDVKGFQCTTDLRYILLRHDVKTVFRNSFVSHYTVYDVNNDHLIPIAVRNPDNKMAATRLQHASWMGNTSALAIVNNNNIYVRDSPVGRDRQITDSGLPGVVYNGVPDWLYQEDVLASPEALWPSPDGSHIIFATFNDSSVRTLSFPWFGVSSLSSSSNTFATFPDSKNVRYPTPESPNPKVRLWVVDVRNESQPVRWEVRPPKSLENQDFYLTSAGWVGNSNQKVGAVWMNRAQNLSIVSACISPSWTCVETHVERAPEDMWLDVQPQPCFSPDGDSFLLLASVQEGANDHFTHIKHVTLKQQRMAVLSHGRYEVIQILQWDTANHLVYYLGTHDTKPGQRHLYLVKDPGADDPKRLEPQCITCDLGDFLWASRYHYGNCSYFGAAISPPVGTEGVFGHYVLECEGPGLPLAALHAADTHRMIRIVFNTRHTRSSRLRKLALPTSRSFTVPLPQGSRAQVQLYLPPSWREELRDAAYPVLVEVNGRPGSQSVTQKFSVDWGTYMSSHNDVVYVKLDVRGAKGLGKRSLYRHLGGVEVQDQIVTMRYLLDTFGFLDRSRIAVWGWGYGGYVTTMLLGSQQSIFRCGIAVSPIADWLYYNSAFTERILGLPGDNYKGYVEADATQRARNIPSHSLYLIHGLADVTAPYQHGVALAKALADAGVMFKYQSYADEGHFLVGVLAHVYQSMEHHLKQCLSLDEDEHIL